MMLSECLKTDQPCDLMLRLVGHILSGLSADGFSLVFVRPKLRLFRGLHSCSIPFYEHSTISNGLPEILLAYLHKVPDLKLLEIPSHDRRSKAFSHCSYLHLSDESGDFSTVCVYFQNDPISRISTYDLFRVKNELESVLKRSNVTGGSRYFVPDGTYLAETTLVVLSDMCHGIADADIARNLHMSEKTVQYHISKAKNAFCARNRAHLAHIVTNMNWVTNVPKI
ncbi:LuxR C-terminal-related transcriptional regulator [Endozoicomonas sp. ALC066]|uniref:LuxR C-terminal-related transcriptional regulator n=1 Tax=Endozoicomonas sp. ALC066 TaxID=3403078 RepID=UPI003BB6D9B1